MNPAPKLTKVSETREAYVLSDLHLGAGGRSDYFKTFGRDAVFANFVGSLKDPKNTTLILNGDIIDFIRVPPLEVPECPQHLLWDEVASLLKLEIVIRAHPGWFEALRNFVANGGRIEYVVGNHDLDMAWKRVQRRFCTELGVAWLEEVPSGGENRKVAFSTTGIHWGNVAIEHGHRYTPESCPKDPDHFIHVWPNPRGPDDPSPAEYLERVWSTDFVLHVVHELEHTSALFSGRVGPLRTLLRCALRNREKWATPADLVKLALFMAKRIRSAQRAADGATAAEQPELVQKLTPEHLVQAFASDEWNSAVRIALSDADFRNGVSQELARLPQRDRIVLPRAAIEFEDDPPNGDRRTRTPIGDPVRRITDKIVHALNWERRAALGLVRLPGVKGVVFGHSHRVADGEWERTLYNPGSWLPFLDLSSPPVEQMIWERGLTEDVLRIQSLYTRDCHVVHIEAGGEHVSLESIHRDASQCNRAPDDSTMKGSFL